MKKKRAGVREVAKLVGVSVATVSRVLNNPEKVSGDTAKRVREAADKLNFIPNSAARALSNNRTRTVGIVIPTLENLTYAKFIDSLECALAEKRYNLVVSTTRKGKLSEDDKVKELINIGVEAIILPGAEHSNATTRSLEKYSIPYIFSSIYEQGIESPTIGYDNYALAQKLSQHLTGLGHQSIAILSGPIDKNDRTRLRYYGAKNEIDKTIPTPNHENDKFIDITTSAAHEAVTELYCAKRKCLKNGITALLCLSDVLAIGAIFALHRLGLKVPEDVSVVGFDNIEMAEFTTPPLTTVNLPVQEMGKHIASEIVSHLETGSNIKSSLIQADIIIRKSSSPPK